MQGKDDMMDSWCIEKATNVVVMLAYAVSAINRLPERPMQDESGLPTEDSTLIGSVFDAIWDATKLLAYHVGASWSPDDAEAIRKDGINGYARVAARYGLTLPAPTADMPDDDPRRLVVRTAWVYYEGGSGWGWMYWPPPLKGFHLTNGGLPAAAKRFMGACQAFAATKFVQPQWNAVRVAAYRSELKRDLFRPLNSETL
jgi:hypothetical protein